MKPALLAWIVSTFVLAGQPPKEVPRFEDFPVSAVYGCRPATPILATATQRVYRTRIRRGVLYGEGVLHRSPAPGMVPNRPNFAGRYIVIGWGCGSQCAMMAVVDAVTGTVHNPPLARRGSELWVPFDNQSEMNVDYRVGSELLILRNGCRDFRNRATCGVYYFRWQNDRFETLRFVAQ